MTPQLIIFYLLAALVVGCAAIVITRKSAVHAAFFLVLMFFGVAGVYIVLHAEFLAAVQVLVYAGGIMVLFLFVIMLVDLEERGRPSRMLTARRRNVGLSVVGGVLLVGTLLWAFSKSTWTGGASSSDALRVHGGNIETVAVELFRYYVLPFELASVLLLVAMVGAVVLARFRV